MSKGLKIGLIVLVVLVIAGSYLVVRLSRGGYLPRPVTVTADLAPTARPLTTSADDVPSTTAAPTAAPSATDQPTSTPTPEGASATEGASDAEGASDTEGASEPPGAATQVVAPPEAVIIPEGFGISVYADRLAGPRMMTVGPDGHLYVAERGANRIVRLPDRDGDGVTDGLEVVAAVLSAPSSLAFYEDGSLYVGETTRVQRLTMSGSPAVAGDAAVIVGGLPRGGHNTRTVLFSPDWAWLYVSVGSSCNVCIEDDPRRATIVRYRPDGSEETLYTTGLRNAVGITFRPGSEELWATNNGRDWLGDDQPPETVYTVTQGDNAGWPQCHSGRIIDPEYGQAGDCEGILDPVVEMQAHTAPLGLGFYTGNQFPEAYRGDLFVAMHGSWNRSVPVGYKVVRIPVGENGAAGEVEDFVSGWLRADGSNWGRPVDVVTATDGSLMISDDGEGRIYRVFYTGP